MSRSEQLLEKLVEQLLELNEKVARQEVRLDDHMRRSEQNEEANKMIAEAIKPIQVHVAMVQGGIKMLGWVGGIVTFVITIGIALWTAVK